MTAENLKNWIKENLEPDGTSITVGCINGDLPMCIGVYNGKTTGSARICVGGRKNTKYQEAAFTILVHWTTSPVTAEAKSREVYNLFYGLSNTDMDGIRVISADPGQQPEWAGRDSRSVCEYVIRLKIIYERIEGNG